jgi:hypothetical protein
LIGCGPDSCLKLTSVEYAQIGSYTVVVTNALGTATTSPFMLNVVLPVETTAVCVVRVTDQPGNVVSLACRNSLGPETDWELLARMSLSSTSQVYINLAPVQAQRFYRAWKTANTGTAPVLDPEVFPAINLSGNVGDRLRLDYIQAIGPTDAWQVLDVITLTNTVQLYFDTSSIDQPFRLYRVVPVP